MMSRFPNIAFNLNVLRPAVKDAHFFMSNDKINDLAAGSLSTSLTFQLSPKTLKHSLGIELGGDQWKNDSVLS